MTLRTHLSRPAGRFIASWPFKGLCGLGVCSAEVQIVSAERREEEWGQDADAGRLEGPCAVPTS